MFSSRFHRCRTRFAILTQAGKSAPRKLGERPMWTPSARAGILFAGDFRYDTMQKLASHRNQFKIVSWQGRVVRRMVTNARLQVIGILVLGVFLLPTMTTAQQLALTLMPVPASVQSGTGSLRVDSSFSVALSGHTEPRLDRAVARFLRQLARQTALPLSLKPVKAAKATLVVQ